MKWLKKYKIQSFNISLILTTMKKLNINEYILSKNTNISFIYINRLLQNKLFLSKENKIKIEKYLNIKLK